MIIMINDYLLLTLNVSAGSLNSKKHMVMGIIVFILLFSIICCTSSENEDNSDDEIIYIHDKIELETITGHTNESFYNQTSINISQTNITKINFTLEWVDHSFDPVIMGLDEIDIFDMDIFGPDIDSYKTSKSNVHNLANRTGYLYLELKMKDSQYIEELGNNPNNIKNETIRIGTGLWFVNITCLNATGFESSCYCPNAKRITDDGNSWKLEIRIHYYYKKD